MGMLLNNTPWHMPVTEKPVLEHGRNLGTGQPHRRCASHSSAPGALPDSRSPPLRTFDYHVNGELRYIGPAVPPEPTNAAGKTPCAPIREWSPASSSLRGLCGPLRLALPHPRARRQRDDAPLRGPAVQKIARVNTCLPRLSVPVPRSNCFRVNHFPESGPIHTHARTLL